MHNVSSTKSTDEIIITSIARDLRLLGQRQYVHSPVDDREALLTNWYPPFLWKKIWEGI